MSVNDFNRGVETQARAHYAFMRRQGEASAELGKRIIKKIDHLGNVVDVLIDELNQLEMERIFGICASLDIGVLDSSDQIKLLSYLKAMTTKRGQTTQQQRDYFFAVKRYLNIGNVSDNIDFNVVSELDLSRSELKAFLECVCEFLFLKYGTKDFLNAFKEELDCFGFNDKIVSEIVATVEKTYEFFGVQGIIEHYSLEPIKREEVIEPIVIPFFEKPIIIIYDENEKYNEECAELLKATIHERLKSIGAKEAVEIAISNEKDSESKKQLYEGSRHIVYIGIPKQAKSLGKRMKWEFDKFGMRYGTFGEKSIITVDEIKKKERKAFVEYVKQNAKQWEKEVKKAVKDAEPILDTVFVDSEEAGGKGAAIFTNIVISTIASPLLLFSAAFDLWTHESFKKDLLKFQHFVAVDNFISSKIDPFLKK